MNRTLAKLALIAVGLALLGGCDGQPKRDPAFAAVRPSALPPPPVNTGAIYQAGHDTAWFEDLKARRVGDVLTIVLQEKTIATKEANTTTSKTTAVTNANPTLLGTTASFNLPGITPLAATKGLGLGVSLDGSHEFEGQGSVDQQNALTGNVTVTVAEVLPNGNLVVRGEKMMRLSHGDEYVRIAGIVRPVDVNPDNTISSTKVADAQIIYEGGGVVRDANTMGWLARFFLSALLPF